MPANCSRVRRKLIVGLGLTVGAAVRERKSPLDSGTHSAKDAAWITAKSIANPVEPLAEPGRQIPRGTIDDRQQRHIFTVPFKPRRDFIGDMPALAVAGKKIRAARLFCTN
jgi:hypothetical protein